MEFVGYRNARLVDSLASAGRIMAKHGDGMTFDPLQYAVLMKMAIGTYDWPLDEQAQKRGALPRTYTFGWLALAQDLGMTLPDATSEIEVIANEPRVPRKEALAVQRISKTAKRLEDAGLIKCLRKGSVQKKNNAVWLLTIGTPEENDAVEKYVRAHMYL